MLCDIILHDELDMTIYYDYHVHCDNSPDCHESLDAMCLSACNKGMKEIMFTDHFEFFTTPGKSEIFTTGYLDRCFERIFKARDRYGDDLFVGYGVELGQPHLQPEEAGRLLSEYPFDFVLASVHKLDDVDLKFFDYSDPEKNHVVLDRYLDNVYRMVCTCDFDVLAHMDLIKRYSFASGNVVRMEERPGMVDRILSVLVARNKGLEVNTSGLRQGTGESMPGAAVVSRFFELGGGIVTFGSDAHASKDVGAGFSEVSGFVPDTYRIASFRKRRICN